MSIPVRLIFIGFILVLTGFVLPLLIVMEIVESTWLLNFLSHVASITGLFLGIIGAAYHIRLRK